MKPYEMNVRALTRIQGGALHSTDADGWNGAFRFDFRPKHVAMMIVSDQGGWEHVSVHVRKMNDRRKVTIYTPTWEEMCKIKDLFWLPEEVVIQYHPAKENYVNSFDHSLHLWKPIGVELPIPPKEFV